MKTIYQGRVVTLTIETTQLPNGSTVELEIVRHPGAAAIVPVTDKGTVILVKQFRLAAGGFIHEIPAGKLHRGEDPRVCAERELEEEIGYRAGSLESLATFLTAPGFTDEVMHLYKATRLVPGTQQLDHDEVLEVDEMPLEQAMEWIRDGRIRDAKTIIGLQMVFMQSNGSCPYPRSASRS